MIKKNKDIDKESLNNVIHLSEKLLKVFYVILIVGIVLCVLAILHFIKILPFLEGLIKVLSPVFIGFIIAWLVYPLHRKITSKGVNKILSAIIVFLIVIAVLVLFFYAFVPIIYQQINEFISSVPSIASKVTSFLQNTVLNINIKGIDVSSVINGVITAGENTIVNMTTSLPNGIINLVKGTVTTVGTLFISLIIGLYILIDYDNINELIKKCFPLKIRTDATTLIKNISFNARKVVNGTLFVALLVFIFDGIGFTIAGLNAGILFGLLCGITDLIPYIGPYIGGAAAVIVGFTQSPITGIIVLIIAIVVQFLENYILQPIVMSKAMKLSPIAIIVGLLLFGHFFGILGMILATPCISIIKEIFTFIYHKVKEKKIEN